jgi:hypothetical protein
MRAFTLRAFGDVALIAFMFELAGWLPMVCGLLEEYMRVRRAAARRHLVGGARVAAALLLVLPCGCWQDSETGAPATMLHDQTPHHGGVVAMAGALHVEAAAAPSGDIRFWLTDEARNEVPLAGAAGSVQVQLADGARHTLPLVARDGVLVAAGPPLAGEEARVLEGGDERLRVELAAPAVRLAVAPAGDVVAVSLRGGTIELRALADGRHPADFR